MFKWIARIPPLVGVPLRYGAIGGILGFVVIAVLYYIDKHPFLIPVFLDFRVALLGVLLFFGLKELRDYYYKGILYFWEGMTAGLILIGTFALLASLLIWLFGTLVGDFVTTYVDLLLTQLRNFPPEVIERIGKEAYERNLAALPATNAFDMAFLYFGQCFVIGLFISILISVILRRQPQNL